MAGTPSTVNSGHMGNNQDISITGVIGTLGTADVGGTAFTLPISVDPATGAAYVYNLAPAGAASNPTGGTLNTIGTIGTLIGAGTLTNVGSLTNIGTIKEITNIAGGTVVAALALNTGTITTIAAGTQNTLGTVGVVNNLAKGTVTAIETGTLTALAVGTIGGKAASGAASIANPVLIAGTDSGGTVYAPLISTTGVQTTALTSSGTILNLATGTIASLPAVSLTSSGTILNLASGTLAAVTSVTNLAAGTVSAVNNIVTGTLAALASGTISVGTVVGNVASGAAQSGNPVKIAGVDGGGTVHAIATDNSGVQQVNLSNVAIGTFGGQDGVSAGLTTGWFLTPNFGYNPETSTWDRQRVDKNDNLRVSPGPMGTSFVVNGTTATAVWGTIIAASGAGTKQYVSGVDIVVTAGTVDVAVTNIGIGGSTGAGVLARGLFPIGGGISKNFFPSMASGTNGTLAYWLGGAGTVNITVQYWNGV